MTPLEIVDPKDTPIGLVFVLYGPPGVGKTTGACSAPGPILVVNAEPGNPLRFARETYGDDKIREVRVTGAKVLDDAYLYLREGGNGECTVIVDSLGEVYRALLEELTSGGRPTLQNYGDAGTKLERFCRALIDLPVNVVLVAHEATVKDEAEGHFERLPFTGTNNPALGVKLMAMADVVAYLGRVQPERDDQPEQFVAQLVSAEGRRGKDRTGRLGRLRAVDLNEWLGAATVEKSKPQAKERKAA